jgi:hypothetical protein
MFLAIQASKTQVTNVAICFMDEHGLNFKIESFHKPTHYIFLAFIYAAKQDTNLKFMIVFVHSATTLVQVV